MAVPQAPPEAWQQAHVDIGALAQRVTGLENSVNSIDLKLDNIRKDFAAKPTNVWMIIGSLGAALGVVGTAIGLLLSPINTKLGDHDHDIAHISDTALRKDDYFRARDSLERQVKDADDKNGQWIASIRDRLRYDEDNAVSRREIDGLVARLGKDADIKAKDVESLASRLEKESEAKATAAANAIARIDKTLDRLNETVAVRSDIDMNSRRTDERIRAIVDSLNEVRHDISSFRQLTPAPIK